VSVEASVEVPVDRQVDALGAALKIFVLWIVAVRVAIGEWWEWRRCAF
jgi:hypothetical protein